MNVEGRNDDYVSYGDTVALNKQEDYLYCEIT
jgi:hypothetical protein